MPALRWDVEHLSRVENVLHRGGSREEWKLEQVRILHINLWSRGKAGTKMKSKEETHQNCWYYIHPLYRLVTGYHETGLIASVCLMERRNKPGNKAIINYLKFGSKIRSRKEMSGETKISHNTFQFG